MKTCPAGCGILTEYVHVLHCKECGFHHDGRKVATSPRMKARREEWKRFSSNDAAYRDFQVKAMLVHLRATEPLDRVYVGPHDMFGQTGGTRVMFGK